MNWCSYKSTTHFRSCESSWFCLHCHNLCLFVIILICFFSSPISLLLLLSWFHMCLVYLFSLIWSSSCLYSVFLCSHQIVESLHRFLWSSLYILPPPCVSLSDPYELCLMFMLPCSPEPAVLLSLLGQSHSPTCLSPDSLRLLCLSHLPDLTHPRLTVSPLSYPSVTSLP